MRHTVMDTRTMVQHHDHSVPHLEEARPQPKPRRNRDTEITRKILLLVFVLLALAGIMVVVLRVPALTAFLTSLLPGA